MKTGLISPRITVGFSRPGLPLIRFTAFLLLVICTSSLRSQEPVAEPPADGASDEGTQTGLESFQLLENRYRERLAEIHAPLIESYFAQLNTLKSTYLRDGKDEEAKRIDEEIAWLKAKPWESNRPNPSDLLPGSTKGSDANPLDLREIRPRIPGRPGMRPPRRPVPPGAAMPPEDDRRPQPPPPPPAPNEQ